MVYLKYNYSFRLGHNLSIDALLEDSNFSYILKKIDADLTRDKIQSTDTAIAVWLEGGGGYSRTGNVRGNRTDPFGLKRIQTPGSGSSAITD